MLARLHTLRPELLPTLELLLEFAPAKDEVPIEAPPRAGAEEKPANYLASGFVCPMISFCSVLFCRVRRWDSLHCIDPPVAQRAACMCSNAASW